MHKIYSIIRVKSNMERFGENWYDWEQKHMEKDWKRSLKIKFQKPWMPRIWSVLFDLNHYYIYKEHNPNAINHWAAQKTLAQTCKFYQKNSILKTHLQVDSSLQTCSISFLEDYRTYSNHSPSPILKKTQDHHWSW